MQEINSRTALCSDAPTDHKTASFMAAFGENSRTLQNRAYNLAIWALVIEYLIDKDAPRFNNRLGS
ncbi:hypothetical protein [Brasilonema bromeliae]|uniref:hypothetical protein n=1 Tax=Brasilonema bromeliae TaxID=383615 RepID=UPI00145D3314|nr:hypothetical protein [Brasilonema bromeliae]